MMYPVRSTLLLTVDENTAAKFLREETSLEQANHTRQPGKIAWAGRSILHRIGHLLLAIGQRLDRLEMTQPADQVTHVASGK